MASFYTTAKPATACAVNGLRNSDQLGGQIESEDTRSIQDIQASRLSRQFGFAFEVSLVVAGLAWGIGR
jgi:hypothetical protein